MNDNAEMTRLGRSLKDRHVTMISIGGVIGAGLFVGSGAAIANAGPAITVSYLAAGAVIFLVMRMLSEMASAFPHTAVFTEYVRFGLGNWGGFVSGWLYWYFWVVVVAIEAIAGAQILAMWVPLPSWQIGLLLMVLLTIVNLMSTHAYGEFEFWFASIKVAAIISFIAIGAAALAGWMPVDVPGAANLFQHGGFAPKGWGAVAAGVVTVIFALTGVEIATVAAAESHASPKVIARLSLSIALRIVLFYVVSILIIVAIQPWTQMVPGLSPFATALGRLGIPWAEVIMNAIVLTAVLSCLNSGIYVSSRILFTLAARGDAPQSLVKLSARRVPVRAIVLGSSMGYLAVLTSVVSASKVFAFLVNASGALMLFIYLMIAFSQLRLRRQLQAESPERLTIRMWAFPWLTYAAIAVMAGVLLAMLLSPPRAVELYASLLCLGIVLAAAAARYQWSYGKALESPLHLDPHAAGPRVN